MWEGWRADFIAFHAFHTLSFPWPALRAGSECEVAEIAPFSGNYIIHERGSPRILHDELGRSDVILSRLHCLVRLLEWAPMYGLNFMYGPRAIQVLLWLDGPPAAQVGKPGGDQCLSVAAEGIQGYVYDAKF